MFQYICTIFVNIKNQILKEILSKIKLKKKIFIDYALEENVKSRDFFLLLQRGSQLEITKAGHVTWKCIATNTISKPVLVEAEHTFTASKH